MKTTVYLALMACALMVTLPTTAQVTFEVIHGMPGGTMHFGFSVQQTQDGGYILAGGAGTPTPSGMEMYLVKMDANGVLEWEHTYGTMLLDMAYCVRQSSDGGYVLCGVFNGFGNDTLTIIRTDGVGEVLWEHRYGGGLGRDIGYSLVETMDGGIAVTGFTGSGTALDIHVLKVDVDGQQLWSRVFDMGGSEYGNTIRQLVDGGFMVLADNGELDSDGDIHLLRLNEVGDTLWTRTFDSGEQDHARGLWVNSDGGYTIAGGRGYPNRDIFLVRTDALGNELWRRFHGDPSLDELAMDVQQRDDGGFIFCGRKEDPVLNRIGMHLFSTDADGYILWEREWQRGIFCEAISLDRTTDGGSVLLGHTTDTLGGSVFGHMFLVKTDGAGYSSVQETLHSGLLLRLYPNPTTNTVTVEVGDATLERIQAFDALGRSVVDRTVRHFGPQVIDLSAQGSGTYLLIATLSGGQRAMARVLVSR
jgi:hypothetical protein